MGGFWKIVIAAGVIILIGWCVSKSKKTGLLLIPKGIQTAMLSNNSLTLHN